MSPSNRSRKLLATLLTAGLVTAGIEPAFASLQEGPGGANEPQSVTTIAGQQPPTRPTVSAAQAPITRENGNWIIPLVRAGVSQSLELNANIDPTELDLPLPAGLRPLELRGTWEPNDATKESTFEAKIGLREFSVSSPSRKPQPFAFGLEGLTTPGNTASTLGAVFALKTNDDNNDCIEPTRVPPVVRDLRLVLSGEPTSPTTIAEFLPPILDRIVIDVPEKFDNAVAEGVLKLTARLVAKYSDQPVSISIRATNAPALTAEPFTRHFRIVGAAKPMLRLKTGKDTTLEVHGNGTSFDDTVEFIGSPAFTTAFSTQVTLTDKSKAEKTPKRARLIKINLDQLRRVLAAQGVNRTRVQFTARQSDVGGPSVRLRLEISGRVVAISGPTRKATVRLSANGRALASSEIALGDGFKLVGAIEPAAMRRENEIIIESDAILDPNGRNIQCGGAGAVIRLELDPDSSVTNEPGVAVAAGFDRFPQALWAGFDVAMAPAKLEQLAAAAEVIGALQEQAQPVLRANVVDWSAGSTKTVTLWVGGDKAQVTRLRPPLVPGPLTIDSPGVLVAGGPSAKSISALEAFETDGVDQLLIATSGQKSDLLTLAKSVRLQNSGWTRLRGDVLVLAGGQTRMAQIRPGTRVPLPAFAEEPKAKKRSPRSALFFGAGVGIGGLLLWLLVLKVFRHYRRPFKK